MKQILIAIALTASTYLANAQAVPSTTIKMCNASEKIDGKLSSSQIVYDDTKEVNYFYVADNILYITHLEYQGTKLTGIERYQVVVAKVDNTNSMILANKSGTPGGKDDVTMTSKYATFCKTDTRTSGMVDISFDNKEEAIEMLKFLKMDTNIPDAE
jgi:hypothetical protein